MRCSMTTGAARTCKRAARFLYLSTDGTRWVAGYCSQHDRGQGPARLLKVRPWEFGARYEVTPDRGIVQV